MKRLNRRILENKKGLEMAFSTIVVIVIALILLAILLIFFTKNFSNFKDKIELYLGSSNVDSVVNNCNLQANNEQKYEYCCVNKTVKVSSREKFEKTCLTIAEGNYSWAGGIEKLGCEGVC